MDKSPYRDNPVALLLVVGASTGLMAAAAYFVFTEWISPTTLNVTLACLGFLLYLVVSYHLPSPRVDLDRREARWWYAIPEFFLSWFVLFALFIPGFFLSRSLVEIVRQLRRPSY